MSDAVPGTWNAVARRLRLREDTGAVAPTVFARMSALAARTGAVNLGQGFPDWDAPELLRREAVAAIEAGHNQYPPGRGTPQLRLAVAEHQHRRYGLRVDPEREVLVTAGATEAITAAVLALCVPGDDIVVLEPTYDAYRAAAALAGAGVRRIPLRFPDFAVTREAVSAAFAGRPPRLLVLNTPHNPTGRVLSTSELDLLANAAAAAGTVVVSDEVYEHLVLDGVHVPMASRPGMASRTLTVSSAGKTFSVTGWKVGWLHGPASLVDAVATVQQFLSYVNAAPFQPAVAAALRQAEDVVPPTLARLRHGRDALVDALGAAGAHVSVPAAGYFVVADGAGWGPDGEAVCAWLAAEAGVVAVPVSAFHEDPADARALVRFAFCKRPQTLAEGASRLAALVSAS